MWWATEVLVIKGQVCYLQTWEYCAEYGNTVVVDRSKSRETRDFVRQRKWRIKPLWER